MVSSRYLFLCSPPKMVFEVSPAGWAIFTKCTPRSLPVPCGAGAGTCSGSCRGEARAKGGSAIPSNFSKGRTRAEWQSDRKNLRRLGAKEKIPSWTSPSFVKFPDEIFIATSVCLCKRKRGHLPIAAFDHEQARFTRLLRIEDFRRTRRGVNFRDSSQRNHESRA